jgi:cell wall-associated NlpC family hydrolase
MGKPLYENLTSALPDICQNRPMRKQTLLWLLALALPFCAHAMEPLNGELAGVDVEGRIDYLTRIENLAGSDDPAALMNTFASAPLIEDQLLARARSQINTPYQFGGTSPKTGFDCSGFVGWVYQQVTVAPLPRTAAAIFSLSAPKVAKNALSKGDLLFYRIRGNRISHVGMYIGEGKFIHATRAGQPLRVESTELPYWKKRFAGAKRLLGSAFSKH